MLLVGFEGLRAPDYILEWLAEGRIAGIILFARNVDTRRNWPSWSGRSRRRPSIHR